MLLKNVLLWRGGFLSMAIGGHKSISAHKVRFQYGFATYCWELYPL